MFHYNLRIIKLRTAARQSVCLLVSFLFFVRYYFDFIVVSAISANLMSLFQFVTMRTLYKCRSRCLVVCKSLISSAFRLFSLRYCHFFTPLLFLFRNVNTFTALFAEQNARLTDKYCIINGGFQIYFNSVVIVIFIVLFRYEK